MMCSYGKSRDDGVSPVVGVMLMLVVTIIIAAVVSAYSGGLSSGQKKAPTMSVETHIKNTGLWDSSYYDFKILGVSEAIPTKDLKIVTSWSASNGVKGGSNVTGWTSMTSYKVGGVTYYGNTHYGSYSSLVNVSHVPYGFGPGVNASVTVSSSGPGGKFWPDQMFGNYTLLGGTTMHNSPCSNYGKYYSSTTKSGLFTVPFTYTATDGNYDPATDRDAMQAVLGENWYNLRQGDVVNVKFIHIPSGKILYNKDVTVEG